MNRSTKTRKGFLASAALGPMAALLSSTIPSAQAQQIAANTSSSLGFMFNRNAFRRIVNRPAQHRHLFAAASISHGDVLSAMDATLQSYAQSLGTPRSKISQVGVLYHGMAVALALNDHAWDDLLLPGYSHLPTHLVNDMQTIRLTSGNPFLHAGPNGTPAQSVEGLTAVGASFLVCDIALQGLSVGLSSALGRSVRDIYSELSGSMLNGTMLVPSGVWAVHALQESRYTYLQASL